VKRSAIADPRSAPRRNPAVVAVDDLMGEPGVVGTRWRMTTAEGEVFANEVVAAEPPAHLVIRSRHVPRRARPRTVVETEQTLVAAPAGTQLTTRVALHTVAGYRLVERFGCLQTARLRRWSNERFRDELEAGAENRKAG
jgi:hypothetical protein